MMNFDEERVLDRAPALAHVEHVGVRREMRAGGNVHELRHARRRVELEETQIRLPHFPTVGREYRADRPAMRDLVVLGG